MDDLSRYDTPKEALLKAVDGAGGPKFVGTTLRPEWEKAPDTASRWIHQCAGDSNRSKLGLGQLVWIFRTAGRQGSHLGFRAFARLCGYDATPIDPGAQLAEAYRHAEAMRRQANEAERDLASLIDNPKLLATLRAHGVNVDALT